MAASESCVRRPSGRRARRRQYRGFPCLDLNPPNLADYSPVARAALPRATPTFVKFVGVLAHAHPALSRFHQRHTHSRIGRSRIRRSSGQSSGSPPFLSGIRNWISPSRGCAPACFMKTAVPALRASAISSRAHPISNGRALLPDSPPIMIQSTSDIQRPKDRGRATARYSDRGWRREPEPLFDRATDSLAAR